MFAFVSIWGVHHPDLTSAYRQLFNCRTFIFRSGIAGTCPTSFFLAPTTNTECSQSSYIATMHLTNAPISIKSLFQNGSQEIYSHGLVFSHPKEDVTRFVVSTYLVKFLVVHSEIIN